MIRCSGISASLVTVSLGHTDAPACGNVGLTDSHRAWLRWSALAQVRLVADGLDVVAPRIDDERAVVVLVVVRAHAGRAVVRSACGDRGVVERADLGAALRAE